jgi:hypothetical protein
MNRLRQRKLVARENRQASLKSQGITVEKTVVKVPQPKALEKKEKVLVEKKKNVLEKVLEVKRGRGRPPKALSLSTAKKPATNTFNKKGSTKSKKGKK